MAEKEYTQQIIIRVTPEQKEFFLSRRPNPSKWLRELIIKEAIHAAKNNPKSD